MPAGKSATESAPAPAALGFSMPAEWEKHEATWLAWPHNPAEWPDKVGHRPLGLRRDRPQDLPRRDASASSSTAAPRSSSPAAISRAPAPTSAASNSSVHPTNRGWTRDTGPIFVRRGAARPDRHRPFPLQRLGQARRLATGPPRARNRRPPPRPAPLPRPLPRPDFVLEGGGIEVNGRGTLLTTEAMLPRPQSPGPQPRPGPARLRGNPQDLSRRHQHLLARRRPGRRRHPRPH